MVEEVTQDHVPVGPAFARSVAFDLRSVYESSPTWAEPPIDMDYVIRRPLSKQADMMSIADALAADLQLCRSLRVSTAYSVSPDSDPCRQSNVRFLVSNGDVETMKQQQLKTLKKQVVQAA